MICDNNKENGTASLEACIAVPIFILLLLFFYGLMVTFSGEQVIKHALIQAGESLSLDSLLTEKLEEHDKFTQYTGLKDTLFNLYRMSKNNSNNNIEYYSSSKKWYADSTSDSFKNAIKNRFLGYVAASADDVEKQADTMLKEVGVVNGIEGVDFSESKINGKTLTIVIKYKQEFVFNFQGLAAFDRKLSISVDMWGL